MTAIIRMTERNLPTTMLNSSQSTWANGGNSGASSLETLLDYEMRCAARYRRFTTLVMVAAIAENCDIHQLLADTMRGSDEYFRSGASGAILMGETDSDGAFSAVNRYRAVNREIADLRFAIAAYPTDAHDGEEMIAIARRRLLSARISSQPGTIVRTE